MIQQISMAQAQPAPHPQQTQPKPETDSFQTQMQKAVGERNKAKEDQSSPVPGKAKDEKTAPGNTLLDQTQALPVVAYLAQPVLPQAELQQVSVSVVAPTVSGIDTSALQGTAQAVVHPQQQTIVSTNAEPAETIPAFRQETSQTNAGAPTDTLPAEKEASAFLANTQAETAQVTANTDSVQTADIPLSTMPKQQNPSVQQPQTIGEKAAVQPAGETISVQAKDSGNSVDLQSQENPVLAQKPNSDSETAVDVAQAPASFSELMGTGNVVIKISDTPAGTEKTAPRQLADQISMKYKQGSPEFEMELFPKDLGKVTVKLAIEKGTMTVEIFGGEPQNTKHAAFQHRRNPFPD